MIAGERAHQAARELPAHRGLQSLAGVVLLTLGEARDARAVVEEAADGFAVVGRQAVHGTLSIVVRTGRNDPWRE